MKLYTEEQVREAFDKGYKYAQRVRPASIEFHYQYVEGEINSLTPIELPTDDLILAQAKDVYSDPMIWAPGEQLVRCAVYEHGAHWVIEQIKQQANGN